MNIPLALVPQAVAGLLYQQTKILLECLIKWIVCPSMSIVYKLLQILLLDQCICISSASGNNDTRPFFFFLPQLVMGLYSGLAGGPSVFSPVKLLFQAG